jgi:hypothetical protein
MDGPVRAESAGGTVYGLAGGCGEPVVTRDELGVEYGSRVWHVSAEYRDLRPPLTVHTVYLQTVPSATGQGWVSSGLREAKSIVAGELLRPAQAVDDAAGRPWPVGQLTIEGSERSAEKLDAECGVGWVLELDDVVVGLVGFDASRHAVVRINSARPLLS